MSKRNHHKRSIQRKEQSERDKMYHFAGQTHQRHDPESDVIPMELIDLTAAFIASLVRHVPSIHVFRENANFIRKTLGHAQVSCSSLLLSLWYIDQIFQQGCCCPHHQPDWSTRDLFVAGIVVADKFLADVCWTNADWVVNTNHAYQLDDVNRLERRFLRDLHYRLYVPQQAFLHFCSFLEFRRIAAGTTASTTLCGTGTGLSYRDIRILSESLPKIYADRLRLSLRPLEAMWLMARTVAAICAVYVTAVATGYALRAYIVQAVQYTLYQRQLKEQAMVMVADALGRIAVLRMSQPPPMAHAGLIT